MAAASYSEESWEAPEDLISMSGDHPRHTGPMLLSRRCGARIRSAKPCRSPSAVHLLNCTDWRDRGDQLSKDLLEVFEAFRRQQRRRSEQAESLLYGDRGGIFLTTDFFGRGTTLLHASEPANKAHQVASIRQSPSWRFS